MPINTKYAHRESKSWHIFTYWCYRCVCSLLCLVLWHCFVCLCGFFGLFSASNARTHINHQLAMLYVWPVTLALRDAGNAYDKCFNRFVHSNECQRVFCFRKRFVFFVFRFCFRDFLHYPFICRHWFHTFQVMDDCWECAMN